MHSTGRTHDKQRKQLKDSLPDNDECYEEEISRNQGDTERGKVLIKGSGEESIS